jgi:hypothetical protein
VLSGGAARLCFYSVLQDNDVHRKAATAGWGSYCGNAVATEDIGDVSLAVAARHDIVRVASFFAAPTSLDYS